MQRGALAAADQAYQASPLLKELKARSEANRASNRRAIEAKYCARQAELGIGDCGGLRYVQKEELRRFQEKSGELME